MTLSYWLNPGRMLANVILGMVSLASPVWADVVTDGREIATAGGNGVLACATCHGMNGEGMAAAGFPYLAGQGAGYLTEQLQNFASGERPNPIMEPIANGLTSAQIEAVSSYFAQLPKSFDATALSNMIDTYPEKAAMGAWIANRGDWDNNAIGITTYPPVSNVMARVEWGSAPAFPPWPVFLAITCASN